MLALLRKYQKSIFIVTTLVVISTFVFYGAFRANRGIIAQNKHIKENVLYQTSQGVKVTDADIRQMAAFLNEEVDSFSQTPINMFNGQFVSHYLFEAGIGTSLGTEFFSDIEASLITKFQKMQNYQPYVHPAWPMMSAEKIWEIFAPDLAQAYKEFKSYENPDRDMFAVVQKLFLQATHLPSSFLQQILLAYQNQNPQLPKDPALHHQDLSLFHAHNLSDWFGKEYLDIVAQFVINTASMAKEKGLSFTEAQVHESLLQNGVEFIHIYGGKEVAPNQVESLLQTFCFQHQCSEKDLLRMWKQVMLCKAYLDQGNEIVFEPDFFQGYMKESAKRLKVSLYQMPKEFQIRTPYDYARIETYLTAIFPDKAFVHAQWPTAILPLENIKEKTPELVYHKVIVNMASLTKDEAKYHISLKDLWDYETGDLGWKKILTLVPSAKDVAQKADRYAFIKQLPPQKKQEVDEVCKNEMLEKNPQWIENWLNGQTLQEATLIIPVAGGTLPLSGFVSSEELLQDLSSLKEKAPNIISKDGVHFYKIEFIDIGAEQIMTFQEAVKEGTLDALVARDLLSFFEEERHKQSSLRNSSYDQVKDQLVEMKYSIKEGIQKRFGSFLIEWAEGKGSSPQNLDPLFSQFMIREEQQTWARGQNQIAASEEIWDLTPDATPTLIQLKDGSIAAAKLEEVFEDQKALEETIERSRRHLENAARKEKAEEILSIMKTKHTYALLSYE